MTGYLKMVIAAVICVSLICGVLPKEGAGKYAWFAAGLIIIAIVVSPLFQLAGEWNPGLSAVETQELELAGESYLMDEFEKTLAQRVKEKLLDDTGMDFEVTVFGKTDNEGNVAGIETVEIAPYSAQYARIVADYIGIAQDRVVEQQ